MDNDLNLKENRCRIVFRCHDTPSKECVYKTPSNCKYKYMNEFCGSTVARANKMIITLKEYGINIKPETIE